MDRSFIERNRASTERIKAMARLSDAELQHPVGEHWTVAIVLAHLSFWDRRVLFVLEQSEQEGKLVDLAEVDLIVNDISLPIWATIPPRESVRLAVEAAEAIDQRLADFPPDLLEQVYTHNQRWVVRAMHRNEHLDEVDQALKG